MHRFQSWTRGTIEVLRAWQRHGARGVMMWPHRTALYRHLRTLPKAQQTQWRRRCKAALWGVALCLAASGVQPALADTITVDGSCTLVDAITTANSDTNTGGCVQTGTSSAADTIVLTVDTTLTTSNNSTFGATGLPVISSTITITGNGHTITRQPGVPDRFRLIAINSAGNLAIHDTTLSGGLTAQGSLPPSLGGGIMNQEGQLRLEGCTVSGNSATHAGGGVWSRTFSGTVSIINSIISGNSAAFVGGGGVYNHTRGGSTLSLVNSTINGNSGGIGGGIFSYTDSTSMVSIVNSMISGNSAHSEGGGVYSLTIHRSMLSLVNSTVSGNLADIDGGGVRSNITNGTLSLVNSTLSGNSARDGGGMFIDIRDRYSTLRLLSSTVTDNTARDGGGMGIFSFENSTVVLHKSLIAGNIGTGNKGDEIWNYHNGGSFLVDDYNLFGHSGVSTADALTGTGAIPGFSIGATDLLATSDSATPTALAAILDTTLASNGGPTLTHALITGSPAIDAAGLCGLAEDQRGVSRPQGVACDIGAFEVMALPEVCGNCLDDDGDGKIDLADEECSALPLSSEKGAFSFKADPQKDQLSLSATFPLGPVFDLPTEGTIVQFFDAAGQLACIQIPAGPVVRKPPGWKVKTERTGTTWSFSDARDGSLGDPTRDKLSVQCNTQQQECTVKLNVKAANIAGDATARNITTGVIIGDDSWEKAQGWQLKAKGKRLVTREE